MIDGLSHPRFPHVGVEYVPLIVETPMYLAPQDNDMPPLHARDCVAIRHFHWIPDLARLA